MVYGYVYLFKTVVVYVVHVMKYTVCVLALFA